MANNPIVIWHTGQSNAWGANVGEFGLSRADIPYWETFLGEDPSPAPVATPRSTSFHALNGNHGCDGTLGRILKDAGYDVIIINLSRGSTFAYSWVPGPASPLDMRPGVSEGNTWAFWNTDSALAWEALKALRPGATFRHIHLRNQGQSDMRMATDGTWPQIVARWAEDTEIIHRDLEIKVGQTIPKICVMSSVLFYQSGTSGPLANWRNEIRAQQEIWCPAAHRIYTDNGTTNNIAFEPDNVHHTAAGYIELGGRIAAKAQEIYPMGSFSTYAKNVQLNHELNVQAHSPAATHYLHLYAAGGVPLTPGNAPGYTVFSFANNTTSWPAPSGRVSANGIELITSAPSGDWPNVVEARITTSGTEGAGEIILSDTFDAMSFNAGTGPFRYAVGALTVTCPTAGFVDAIAHRMMGLVLGGTTYTAPAQKWISYYAGNPQSGGAIAGSRVAMTMASTFGSASSGYSYTTAAISLPHQATGTYIAVHDAAAAGNLVFSGARPDTLGLSGTIPAGTLRIGIP